VYNFVWSKLLSHDTSGYILHQLFTISVTYQNAGKNHNIKICNRYFENMAQFKYMGMTVANQTLVQEKIEKGLN
jgi:hypothetical protein